MLSVVMTVMPASSSSSTSCQRFSLRRAGNVGVGELVDQSDLGLRARIASISISSNSMPLWTIFLRGMISRSLH